MGTEERFGQPPHVTSTKNNYNMDTQLDNSTWVEAPEVNSRVAEKIWLDNVSQLTRIK